MQITACPIALPLGKLSALAGVKFIAVHCSATRPTAIMGVRIHGGNTAADTGASEVFAGVGRLRVSGGRLLVGG